MPPLLRRARRARGGDAGEDTDTGAGVSLRPLLALLPLLVAGPLFALLLHGASSEREQALGRARAQAVALARLGAEQQGDSVQQAETLLRVLARVPAVRAGEAPGCHELLRRVAADHPRIGALVMADADGRVACNSVAERPGLSIADRPHFRQAMQAGPGAIVWSGLIVGRSTGKPTIGLATPLPPARDRPDDGPGHGRPGGVLVAALDLEWLSRLADRLPGAAGQLVQVFDARDGAVLARSSDAPEWVGRRFPDAAVPAALRAGSRGGAVEAADPDGVERITGYAPLPGAGAEMAVAVGLDRAGVLAAADRRLRRDLLVAAGVACAAVLLSWLLAGRALLRPIRALAAGAARVGAGDLAVQLAPCPGAAREAHALRRAFNAMARKLAARDRELAEVGAELARSEARHRLLAETCSDMITLLDAGFRRTYVSPACRELLGYEPEELLGQSPGRVVHPRDREAWVRGFDAPLRAGHATAQATYRAAR